MVEHTRTLDFKIAFAIGLGTMIAAGIFSLSGTAVHEIGSSAVIAFVIAAVIAGITAAAYSEFASIYAENGGGYLFSSRTFENERLIYAIGAMLFLGYTGTTAFYLATMDEWVFEFVLPESVALPLVGVLHPHVLPHGTAGVLTALLLGWLNAHGTEESGTFQLLVTGAKVAVLFAFVGGALAYTGPTEAASTFATDFSTDAVGIVSIAALAFITFFGFSAIAASAGEIIEPRKTVPRAIAASMVTVTVLYTFVIVAIVNTPQNLPGTALTRAEALQQGETAMGIIASTFLGPAGQTLIVAGAIFSMVSASNASILAASGIGSLMGRQGQAPRRFSHIHPEFGTPFWSVTGATATIVALIVVFIGLFPADGGAVPFDLTLSLPVVGATTITDLGLESLTGFATLNLLLPLSVVNVALVYSRRRFPDVERGFRVPGVPVLPAIGVVANLALIYNLPFKGVVTGLLTVVVLVVAYLVWGGAPDVSELVSEVVAPAEPAPTTNGDERDRFTVLVPVARPERAARYVRLAAFLGRLHDDDPFVEVLTVTEIPDQTPSEMEGVQDTARARAERIEGSLAAADLDVEYAVSGHICRDISFDILQTAREDRPDAIVMGYPESHHEVAETVEFEAPCDVYFASGFGDAPDFSVVTIGAGGGPHHEGVLPVIDRMANAGSEVHLVTVSPTGGGVREHPEDTVAALSNVPELQMHNVSAASVAEGLVSAAEEQNGVLIVGATRTRRLRRWVFGSTPDRVIALAEDADVPVIVFATSRGITGPLEDYTYPVFRRFRRLFSDRRTTPGGTHDGSDRS
jgi:amino acid transporter/nucleotide-binding universal stress UspA family protein